MNRGRLFLLFFCSNLQVKMVECKLKEYAEARK